MGRITKALDELRRRAERGQGLEREELALLVAELANVPPAEEIESIVEDLEDALYMASSVVARMSKLVRGEESERMTDLSALVLDLEALVRDEIERVAEFTVEVPDEPCMVRIPRAWAVQVIAAMLSTSSKAIVESRRSNAEIELRLVLDENMAQIEVIDDGVETSADLRTDALELFPSTRRTGSGGLGLTTAAGYIQRLGGDVQIGSEDAQRTSVRVLLPLADAQTDVTDRGRPLKRMRH
jgi:signal transduction histidine kinase